MIDDRYIIDFLFHVQMNKNKELYYYLGDIYYIYIFYR
jgi:hypothetical protein